MTLYDLFHRSIEHLPFMLGVTNVAASKINMQRIIEAVVIAAITAAASAYLTVARVEERISFIQLSEKETVSLIREEQAKRESADLRQEEQMRKLTELIYASRNEGRKH
jgi:hypothetical protein